MKINEPMAESFPLTNVEKVPKQYFMLSDRPEYCDCNFTEVLWIHRLYKRGVTRHLVCDVWDSGQVDEAEEFFFLLM